jgi:predicted PurR-regulated permease PerM
MASLFGITGILLAIPFAAIIQILVKDTLMWKKYEKQTNLLTKKGKKT